MWNPKQHTDEENTQWCWLRAVEWGRWPLFISQLYAPPLLIFAPWEWVVGGFFLANLLWASIRYRFINVGMANAIADHMIIRWPVTIGCAIYLAWHQHYGLAALAFLWLFVAIVLGIVTPTQIGRIQKIMMRQLGYEPETSRADGSFADAAQEASPMYELPSLHDAAVNGDTERLKQLLASCDDVNCQEEEQGYTPLHLTSAEGHLSATRVLLEFGASPHLMDYEGYSPLHLAATQGKTGIISVLLAAGADIDSQSRDGSTPLHLAAGERHASTVGELLEAGATVDLPDEDLRTPLHMAVFWTADESPAIVESLLKNGSNPRWPDRHGKTPISRAEENEFDESLKLLIAASSQWQSTEV